MHLDRRIANLEIVAAAGRPETNAEIQKTTGLPKPTCYRQVQTLQDQGLVETPSGDGRVGIGERLIRIALPGKSDVDMRRAAAPPLKAAAIQFNETDFLARFRNGQVEIIHVETPNDPGRACVDPAPGVRPMRACSCSKAIEAFTEPEFPEPIIGGSLTAYTEHTGTTDTELRADLTRIAERGFADCVQEIDLGIASVAAPVSTCDMGAPLSVGSIRRFADSYRSEIGLQLVELADRISGAIQPCNVAEV